VEINSVWEMIGENYKISAKESLGHYYELKKHKLWFDEGCSELLNQRKQVKLQRLKDPNKINGDNLNNVRHVASKINELATNSTNKNIRDLYRGIK
jgi:hypothetical protein